MGPYMNGALISLEMMLYYVKVCVTAGYRGFGLSRKSFQQVVNLKTPSSASIALFRGKKMSLLLSKCAAILIKEFGELKNYQVQDATT